MRVAKIPWGRDVKTIPCQIPLVLRRKVLPPALRRTQQEHDLVQQDPDLGDVVFDIVDLSFEYVQLVALVVGIDLQGFRTFKCGIDLGAREVTVYCIDELINSLLNSIQNVKNNTSCRRIEAPRILLTAAFPNGGDFVRD